MKIKRIISQSRRDFTADYECEHCGFVDERQRGYDDSYFHNSVIPKMQCPECGESAAEDYRAFAPKYADGVQV